jgi:hypothetical protein
MSSINKILNDALDQTLLSETEDVQKSVDKKETIIETDVETKDDIKSTLDKAETEVKTAAANPLAPETTAAIGAGIGALVLAKKLRAKKEAAIKA